MRLVRDSRSRRGVGASDHDASSAEFRCGSVPNGSRLTGVAKARSHWDTSLDHTTGDRGGAVASAVHELDGLRMVKLSRVRGDRTLGLCEGQVRVGTRDRRDRKRHYNECEKQFSHTHIVDATAQAPKQQMP